MAHCDAVGRGIHAINKAYRRYAASLNTNDIERKNLQLTSDHNTNICND